MINLRPLVSDDIPNLPQIRPTYKSSSILEVEKSGSGLEIGWKLVERNLPQPFDKGTLYDFDEIAQAETRARLERPDDTYQRVAESSGQLVGLLDIELQPWNDTAFLWNLMIDLDYRGQGLGRRLWHRALDFARQSDVRAIMIETQNTNVPACKFYARMGCELVGINEAYYPHDGSVTEVALFWAYRLPGYRASSRR
jgi:ribosomal protein S18 acetylase RimI-like enzyme